jgi:hypothetical protein
MRYYTIKNNTGFLKLYSFTVRAQKGREFFCLPIESRRCGHKLCLFFIFSPSFLSIFLYRSNNPVLVSATDKRASRARLEEKLRPRRREKSTRGLRVKRTFSVPGARHLWVQYAHGFPVTVRKQCTKDRLLHFSSLNSSMHIHTHTRAYLLCNIPGTSAQRLFFFFYSPTRSRSYYYY